VSAVNIDHIFSLVYLVYTAYVATKNKAQNVKTKHPFSLKNHRK